MNASCGFSISEGDPCLAGHFPGNPIVPGVVILEHVIALAEAGRPGCRVTGVPRVKFLRPVAPGEQVTVGWHAPADSSRLRFECFVGAEKAAAGTLDVGNASD